MSSIVSLPLFKPLILVILGLLLEQCCGVRPNFNCLILSSIFFLTLTRFSRSILSSLFISIALIILGFSVGQLDRSISSGLDSKVILKSMSFRGEVMSLKHTKFSNSAIISGLHCLNNGTEIPIDGACILYLKDSLLRLKPGDQIYFRTKLDSFKHPIISHHFDKKEYHEKRGVLYKGRADKVLCFKSKGLKTSSYRARVIDFVENKFNRLGFSPRDTEYLKALLIGDKSNLDSDLKKGYQSLGLSHVLAVSGMHVGMVWMLISYLLKLIPGRQNRKLKALISLLALWLYVLVTGATPSVTRAGIMLSMYGLASIYGINALNLNIVFSSALIMLVLKPSLLSDLGFQLSFCAVFGIILLLPAIRAISIKHNSAVGLIIELIAISIVAQLFTLPLSLYYFKVFPNFFLLSNLLFLPTLTIEIYTAVVCLAIPESLNAISFIAKILEHYVSFKNQFILDFSTNDLLLSYWPIQSKSSILIFYVIILLGVLSLVYRQFRYLKWIIVLFVFIAFNELLLDENDPKNRLQIEDRSGNLWVELKTENEAIIVADTSQNRWAYHIREVKENYSEIRFIDPNQSISEHDFVLYRKRLILADTTILLE